MFCRPPGNARSAVSVSSGNFVRLNMKLKRYKRKGGRPTSGPVAKRLAWKQKMQSRNKSRGSSCFKCGEEGHWAKDCKGKFSSGEMSSYSAIIGVFCYFICMYTSELYAIIVITFLFVYQGSLW